MKKLWKIVWTAAMVMGVTACSLESGEETVSATASTTSAVEL